MAMLERDILLNELRTLLAKAVSAKGCVVSLYGEAGVGKSSLAQALASSAGPEIRVLWGACEDLTTPEPLGPLHDLMRRSGWHPDENASQVALSGAVLDELAARPTLVVLEDLHWADDATLDVVRFIGRRIHDKPIMVLVTARNEALDAQSRLRRALVNIPPDVAVRMEVRRLSEATVETLAKSYGQHGATVYALTGGNPFLTMEVLRSGEDCPASVRDALLLRADRLSGSARQALEAASIFPRRVEDWLLDRVLGAPADEGLAECVAAGLLQLERGFYAFAHEIARRAIEGAVPPHARTALNRKALAALRDHLPDATARLVHHAMAAGDEEAVAKWAPRAAEEAAQMGAHHQAARHYAAALALAHALAPSARADLLERMAFEELVTGRLREAVCAHDEALTLRRAMGDQLAVGNGLRALGRVYYNLGQSDRAGDCARESIEVLEPLGPTGELATAYANMALFASLGDDRDSAKAWAAKAILLAQAISREDIVADALSALQVAEQWADPAAAQAHFERGMQIAMALDRQELVARLYTNASCVALSARNHAEAHRLLRLGIEYCDTRDLDTWTNYMRGWLAGLLLSEGRWQEARDGALEVVELQPASPLLRFPAAATLARYCLRTGAGDAASWIGALNWSEAQRLLIHAPIAGEHAWITESGVEAALKILAAAATAADAVGNIWAAGQVAYWRAKLGDTAPTPQRLALPYQLQFNGDWRAAAAMWAAHPAPYEQALALLEGDEDARAEALSILTELGADATLERVRKDMRQRGVRSIPRGPRAATRANAAGLTPRQMDVLQLLDRGLSNGEIAEALGVSTKTVDHHVSAVLEKLDASTRGEAAARARQVGLIGSDSK